MRADGTLAPDRGITAEKIREFRRLTAPLDNPRENPQQLFDRLVRATLSAVREASYQHNALASDAGSCTR
jgi:hypothetical protein